MTELDKRLIQKAEKLSKYRYYYIDILMEMADTAEARERLAAIRMEYLDLIKETL